MTTTRPAILATGLEKRFGTTQALRGLSLAAEPGSILGVLGPNGAGKTTAVRILSTLLKPDAGRAEVAGFDVLRQPDEVRRSIGLTGQYAALDELLTGRENLEMIGRLYHLPPGETRRRARELLIRFNLEEAGDRLVKTYSGGMRRRLDLGASLVASPPVVFLDEPTTGLDPRSRLGMWELIKELAAGGTTLLLTTQYLDEADRLADRIVVVDGGRVIAEGSAEELKATIGGQRLAVSLAPGGDLALAARLLGRLGSGPVHVDDEQRRVVVAVQSETGLLSRVVREFDAEGLELDDIGLHGPTLDDVFLSLTGHAADAVASPPPSSVPRSTSDDQEEAA